MKTQRALFVFVILTTAVLSVFLTKAHTDETDNVQQVIKARAIELVDEQENVRAQLNTEPGGEVIFRLRDANGTIRVKIGANESGSGLLLLDESTEPRVHLLAKEEGGSITLTGKEQKKKVIVP